MESGICKCLFNQQTLITLEALDNRLETIHEVSEQTQYDIDREAGWNKE